MNFLSRRHYRALFRAAAVAAARLFESLRSPRCTRVSDTPALINAGLFRCIALRPCLQIMIEAYWKSFSVLTGADVPGCYHDKLFLENTLFDSVDGSCVNRTVLEIRSFLSSTRVRILIFFR